MTQRQGDEKNRARLEILNYITSFCLTHIYQGDLRTHGSIHGFVSGGFTGAGARPGDLVALQSAPTCKWHLSWLIAVDPSNTGYERYLLESIHDGEQCWWTNVGLDFLERDEVAAHPSWRWTDDQFAFKDRWWRACYKKRDAYTVLPVHPEFHNDGSVTLRTRIRHGWGTNPPPKTFSKWRQVKVRDMLAYYDEAEAFHDAENATKKAAREAAEAAGTT